MNQSEPMTDREMVILLAERVMGWNSTVVLMGGGK